VVIATPDGRVPRPDPWGLEPFFHYPQVDEDFMFSVLRRFAYHPDRVRVTFTHFSELNLVAIRRVYRGLLDAGMEPAGARKAVESAAHRAWRHNRDFIEVLTEDDEVTSRLPAMRIRQIRDEVWQESQARANRAAEALARLPGLQHPGNLAALSDEEIMGSDGVFIPGGNGPMLTSPTTRISAASCGWCTARANPSPRCVTGRRRSFPPRRPTGCGCSTATG